MSKTCEEDVAYEEAIKDQKCASSPVVKVNSQRARRSDAVAEAMECQAVADPVEGEYSFDGELF